MSITTRSGDTGETGILFGHRLRKDDLRVHTTGALDELDAGLGLARALFMRFQADHLVDCPDHSTDLSTIDQTQRDLVALMGQINTLPEDWERYRASGYEVLTRAGVDRLETVIGSLESSLPSQKHWTIPGAAGDPAAAALEVARTVCRRAERHVLSLLPEIAGAPDDFHGLIYLNRLSDCLWLLARRWELPD
jgi:cob(I)alamin adenosyltransferase